MAPRKMLLDATTRAPSAFSEFTRNYRQSSNIEDRRDSQKELRDSRTPTSARGGVSAMRPDSRGGTGSGREISDGTPDDYTGGAAEGGSSAGKTRAQYPSAPTSYQAEIQYSASQARKVDPEEAIAKAGNR